MGRMGSWVMRAPRELRAANGRWSSDARSHHPARAEEGSDEYCRIQKLLGGRA
jgi:hypothetical protein